jgi:uncharacterized protein with PIN domain
LKLNPNSSIRTLAQPEFLADEMLGRLAKWLMILGYNTEYVSNISDSELLKIAELENRIILTRDTLLIRRKLCRNFIFIRSDHWREQLRQVYLEAGLNCDSMLTMCAVCNRSLHAVEKNSIKSLVPAYVYEAQEKFSKCESCLRIYWPATHISRIRNELENLREGV